MEEGRGTWTEQFFHSVKRHLWNICRDALTGIRGVDTQFCSPEHPTQGR